MAKHTQTVRPQILEEASTWFIDFNEEQVDQAGCMEFDAWLRRSPEHVRAFLQVSAFWEDAGALGKRSGIDIDALIARAKAEHNVYSLEFAASERIGDDLSAHEEMVDAPRSASRRSWLAIAASVSLAIGLSTVAWHTFYRAQTYTTEIGEQRSITLEDGSLVQLNSRSRIKVRFRKAERTVDLLEGQALFTVAKNSARPFVVITGDSHVRAVGTQFDVYRKRTGTVITVVEGRVAVAPTHTIAGKPLMERGYQPEARLREVQGEVASDPAEAGSGPGVKAGEILLAAGQQLMVTQTTIDPPKPANIVATMAWTDKLLIFDSTPLSEVVEEINRYNRQQLVIRDPELYDFHISGGFSSTDSSRILEFLRQRFGVIIKRSNDVIEISRSER